MKFIHTSDWHIGRQFHHVSLLEDQQYVLNQLVNYVESEAAEAVIIAGDIYDRAVPPAAAVELLDQVLHKLCSELKVPVIMVPGNHDSAGRLRFASRQLQQSGLHILGDLTRITTPVVIPDKTSGLSVSFFGIPYADPEMVREQFGVPVSTHDEAHTFLVDQIRAVMKVDSPNVLISHCFVDGGETSESERPLAIGGVECVSAEPMLDFDYVALGHLHSPQFRVAEYIRYSGSLLKYSFSEEEQSKGIELVDISVSGFSSARHLPLRPVRDLRVIEGLLETLIEQGKSDPQAHDYLLVRLLDHQALLDPMSKLREIYPNVLHLEKPGLLSASEQVEKRSRTKRGELELFQDFFLQMTGQPLTKEQEQALKQTLRNLHKAESATI